MSKFLITAVLFISGFFVSSCTVALASSDTCSGTEHYYVSPSGTGTDCSSSSPCDFQTALNLANADGSDSVIHVGSGTYQILNTLVYPSPGDCDLSIIASGPDKPVLRVPADEDRRIMWIGVGDNDFYIKGLIFKNGNSEFPGGALAVGGEGQITIEECEFIRNRADFDGGAVSVQSNAGTINIINSKFYNNMTYGLPAGSSGGGGALDVRSNHGNINIIGSIFRMNSGTVNGGAIEASTHMGIIRIESCIFEGNVSFAGGAVNAGSSFGKIHILNNIFHNNFSQGSALLIINAPSWVGCPQGGNNCPPSPVSVVVINNTFHSNISHQRGGAMGVVLLHNKSEIYIHNNIFWGNASRMDVADRGDELYINTGGYRPGIKLYNNIFSLNASFSGTGSINSEDIVITDITNFSQGGNITADPLFADGATGDLHITSRSPAIDAGNMSAPLLSTLSSDFEGDSRILGFGVDIGADEFAGRSRANPRRR